MFEQPWSSLALVRLKSDFKTTSLSLITLGLFFSKKLVGRVTVLIEIEQ